MPEPLVLGDLRGGINEVDSPFQLPNDQVLQAYNIDYTEGGLAHKRPGAADVSGHGFSNLIASLLRYQPSSDETLAQIIAVDVAGNWRRRSGGSWSSTTPTDAITLDSDQAEYKVNGVSLGGKHFIAYKSGQDRLHVFDGTTLRRAGVGTPAAPTSAETGAAGSYSGTRYFRVRYVEMSGSTVLRRGEAGAVLTVNPSGTKTGTVVTKPATLSEGETHWELEASLDNSTFYRIAQTAVGTTTYTDTASSYTSGATPDAAGANTAPFSAKFVAADEDRLLMAGSWTTADYSSDVWWTPVSRASGVGNNERINVNQTYRVTLDDDEGGGITGITSAINGAIYVFKRSHIYKLVRTGVPSQPYDVVLITKKIGCIDHKTIVEGVDEAGRPAIYFLAQDGPRRIGYGGVVFCGRDITTTWRTVNFAASVVLAHGVYHTDKKQVWFWVSTSAANTPNLKLCFNVERGVMTPDGIRKGWTLHNGNSADATCSFMFATTLSSTVSLDQKPYIGRGDTVALLKCDTGTDDAGTDFRSYFVTKPYALAGLSRKCSVEKLVLAAKAGSGVTIRTIAKSNFGLLTKNIDILLTPSGSESHVIKVADDGTIGEGSVVQFEIGDSAAADNTWTLDRLEASWRVEEPA